MEAITADSLGGLVSYDDAGIYSMRARFCDIFYLLTKTINPATLKQLNYEVDQTKITNNENYAHIFAFGDLFEISNPAPNIDSCSYTAATSSSTINIIGLTVFNNNDSIALEIQHNPNTLASETFSISCNAHNG